MHLLRALLLRSNRINISSLPTSSFRECRQQKWRPISLRFVCQTLVLQVHQKQWLHSSPRPNVSQDKKSLHDPHPTELQEEKPPAGSDPSAAASSDPIETDPLQDKSISLLQRFKKTFKQYGKVLIPVHLVTSTFWFGSFYYAAMKGVNVVPFLEFIGLPDVIVNILKHSQSGNALTAYAMYKIATPARYTVTLGGTSLSVKYLRRYGFLSTPPLVKEYLQDRMEETRDIISGKMEETKDRISEKLQETKDKVSFRKKKEE
ncbi:protein FAM210A isoform X1 [Ascaphus truei]|uniref:protein FAM210A isoform X1 n=1 Tax=Ascaphus truei TaxID=8439 RepID=UPI003F59B0E6